jgi:hypothetical protein
VTKKLEELKTNGGDLDRYKIRKLYPDAMGNREQEWYFDMDNPTSDRRLENVKDHTSLRREDDGSWSATGVRNKEGGRWQDGNGQVRLEGWSESRDKKWLNTEITVYGCYDRNLEGEIRGNDGWKELSPGPYAFQLYGRGGHHGNSHDERCDAACYKIGLRRDGDVEVRKEPTHGCYLPDKGTRKGTEERVKDQWIGLKQVLYNFEKGGKTCVANEIWIDDKSHDDGKLADPPRNRWKHVVTVIDTGGWGGSCDNFVDDCDLLDRNERGGRRRKDHIITESGGPNRGNLGALRSDMVKLKFKFFSIREIQPPEPAEDAVEA